MKNKACLLKRSVMVRCCVAFLIMAIIVLLYWYGILDYMKAEWLKENSVLLHRYVDSYPVHAHGIYLFVYIIARALAIPGSLIFVTAGGMFLGQFSAFVCGLIAITIGSALSFLLSRYLVGDFIQKRYKEKLEAFNGDIERYGFYYLLALRWIGIMPTFLINLLSGLSTVSLSIFIQTTALGSVPAVLFFSYIGKSLGCVTSFSTLCQSEALLPLCVFVGYKMILIPVVLWAIKKRRGGQAIGLSSANEIL